MSKITVVTCDQCQADLTLTSNMEDYRIVLGNESRGHSSNGDAVTCMAISPPLPHTLHFCDVACLSVYIADKYPKAQEQYVRKLARRTAAQQKNNPSIEGQE